MFLRNPDIAIIACRCFWSVGRAIDALGILEQLADAKETIEIANIVASFALINSDDFTSGDRDELARIFHHSSCNPMSADFFG